MSVVHWHQAQHEIRALEPSACLCGRPVVAGSRDGRCDRCTERALDLRSDQARYGDDEW